MHGYPLCIVEGSLRMGHRLFARARVERWGLWDCLATYMGIGSMAKDCTVVCWKEAICARWWGLGFFLVEGFGLHRKGTC